MGVFAVCLSLATYVFISSDWLHISIHHGLVFLHSFQTFGLGVSIRAMILG